MTSLQLVVDSQTIEQLFLFSFFGFLISMLLTPLYTTAAFSGKWWKKARTTAITGETAKVYQKLHAAKHQRNIPTMAGIIFVLATVIVTVAGNLSRSQTWLPLAAMAGAGAVGLIDDLINIRGVGGGIAGMRAKILKVARAVRRQVLVVADGRVSNGKHPPPGCCILRLEGGERTAFILHIAQGEHRR